MWHAMVRLHALQVQLLRVLTSELNNIDSLAPIDDTQYSLELANARFTRASYFLEYFSRVRRSMHPLG